MMESIQLFQDSCRTNKIFHENPFILRSNLGIEYFNFIRFYFVGFYTQSMDNVYILIIVHNEKIKREFHSKYLVMVLELQGFVPLRFFFSLYC